MKTKFSLFARILLLLVFLTGCGLFPAALVGTPTALPATPEPPGVTVTASATRIPPGETPSLLPTSASTDTPQPSPTPDGFVRDSFFGLTLMLPKDWKINSQDADGLVISDRWGDVLMIFTSAPEPAATPMDDIVKEMQSNSDLVVKGSSEFSLAGGSATAEVAELTYTSDGQKMDMWLVYSHQGTRGYLVWVIGRLNSLKNYREEVGAVLDTLQTFRPSLYDLPASETLTQLGGDPLPEELDPARATGSAQDYAGLLYAGLVRLDRALQVAPDLAESWTISPDGLVYTFKLRAGITFANGHPITASDFQKSWERALDPATHSQTAGTYLGDILGAQDRLAGKAEQVTGIKVLDDQTLAVSLDGPKAYFLAKLTYPVSYVVDPSQPKAGDDQWVFKPNASGPYTIKEYKETEALILERNRAYYQPAIIKNLLFIFEAGGSALSLYEEGTIDLLPVGYADLLEIQKPGNAHNKELVTAPSMCTSYLVINPGLAPTDDPLVRKALFLATDREEYVNKLTNGMAILANGILPPAMPGFQAERVLPEFDAAAAKAALAQSTYAGKPLTIVLSAAGYAGSQRNDVALLVDQWQKALGIKVTVDLVDPEKFSETVRKKPGNVVVQGWCADYPDPENFLDVLFHSGSNFNYTNMADAELDDLLDQARVALDPAERLKLYAQAEAHILDQFLAIPLSTSTSAILINPRVKDYTLTAIGVRILDSVSLEP